MDVKTPVTQTAESTTEIPTSNTIVSTTTETTTTVIPNEESTTEIPTSTTVVVTTTETMVETTATAESITESTTDAGSEVTSQILKPAEVIKDKLSEQIRKILKHYQGPDPTGFPGAPIPDPMSIPPMKNNVGGSQMTFTNMTVHGLSKFQVDRVDVDLKKMHVRNISWY